MLRHAAVCILLIASSAASVDAQVRPPRLASVFPDLFGPHGLVVNSESVLPDGSTHSAHFNSAFQSNFTQFNVALVSQLTSLPLPSPASGFTYASIPAPARSADDAQLRPDPHRSGRDHRPGPLCFGFNYQHFSFDRSTAWT